MKFHQNIRKFDQVKGLAKSLIFPPTRYGYSLEELGKVLLMSLFVCVKVLGPVNPMGSCRARSVYLTIRFLGRLSPLSD